MSKLLLHLSHGDQRGRRHGWGRGCRTGHGVMGIGIGRGRGRGRLMSGRGHGIGRRAHRGCDAWEPEGATHGSEATRRVLPQARARRVCVADDCVKEGERNEKSTAVESNVTSDGWAQRAVGSNDPCTPSDVR
jgi:hypothetical protein